MQITRIEAEGKKRRVYLNDAPAFRLFPSEIDAYHLREGQELPEALLREIYSAVLTKRAKLRCLNLLAARDRTKRQLEQKLKEDGYPPEVAQEAIAYAQSLHYLDDERFARHYIENGAAQKGRGRIFAELASKGISRETAERAYDEAELPAQDQVIRRWMEKKGYDPEDANAAEQRKMIRFLMQKGFSYEEIRRVLKSFSEIV